MLFPLLLYMYGREETNSKNYHFTSCEFFMPYLTGGLLLRSKWQQVSLSFQNPSQYSDRSQQCFCLSGIDSFSDF